ncbi:hypothetical protein CRENBAI_012843, partial [Crenichthys baileyi]
MEILGQQILTQSYNITNKRIQSEAAQLIGPNFTAQMDPKHVKPEHSESSSVMRNPPTHMLLHDGAS